MESSKVTLHTKTGMEVRLGPERVSTAEVTLPGEPYSNKRLWIVGNEYGALGAVWAKGLEDALDELVDRDLGAGLLVDDEYVSTLTDEERDELATLGNASEYADLQHAWAEEVAWEPARDWYLLAKLAEARGADVNLLSDVLPY